MASHKLCKVEDVPVGKLGGFSITNKDIIVANLKGKFYCLAGRCTHGGAPLKEGVLTGEILECPWHSASFNIKDGTVINGPPKAKLKVYTCTVKGKYIYVDLPLTWSEDS
jgi:nitrite reductase/ring-hydroxylating ferredoxin subunit